MEDLRRGRSNEWMPRGALMIESPYNPSDETAIYFHANTLIWSQWQT